MSFRKIILFFVSFLFSLQAFAAETPFPVSLPDKTIVMNPGESQNVMFTIEVPPQYFIYRDKTAIEFVDLKGMQLEKVVYPPSQWKNDPFFKKRLEVLENEVVLQVLLKAPSDFSTGQHMVEGTLKFQGCSDVLCYPEETHLFTLNVQVGSSTMVQEKNPPSATGTSPSLSYLLSVNRFEEVVANGWWIVLAVVFLGGVLTSLTPCVLPLIPVTLLIVGVRAKEGWRKNFYHSFVLVLGLCSTYALLGVLAVAFGKTLGFVFQSKVFVGLLIFFLIFLSLSLFGFYEIKLPHFLSKRFSHIKGEGFSGAFFSGAVTGLLAAPCAGPVIGALLLFVSGTQNYLQGFFLLFVYAFGMGVLFLILGTGYGTLHRHFKRLKCADGAKKILGVALLIVAAFYINSLFQIEQKIQNWFQVSERIAWLSLESEALTRAKAEHKPIIIDFYADWCAPCKELDHGFFRRPEVLEKIKQLIPLRVDATFADDPEAQRLKEKYGVIGFPSIVFVDSEGRMLKELSVIAYNTDLLWKNIQKVTTREP